MNSFYHNHLRLRLVFQNICDKFNIFQGEFLGFRAFTRIFVIMLVIFAFHLVFCLNLWIRTCCSVICNTVSDSFSAAVSLLCILNKMITLAICLGIFKVISCYSHIQYISAAAALEMHSLTKRYRGWLGRHGPCYNTNTRQSF